MSAQPTSAGRLGTFADRHLAVLLSAAVVAQAGIGVLIFARFDIPTALAVVQEQGATSIALGQVISFAQIVLAMLLCYGICAPQLRKQYPFQGIPRPAAWIISAGSLATLLPTQPAVFALVMPPLLLLMLVGLERYRIARRNRLVERLESSEGTASAIEEKRAVLNDELAASGRRLRNSVAFGVVMIVGVLTSGNWLPNENIEFTDGSTMTAFVISSSANEVVLARDHPRQIVRVASESVAMREICFGPARVDIGRFAEPMFGLVKRPPYPECGDWVLFDFGSIYPD